MSAEDFFCTDCGVRMGSYDEYPEYQHEGCGGLVKRREPMERKTDKRGAVRPVNRLRVVYDGEPISARVELLVTGDDGIESVHDIPVEEAMFFISPKGGRLVLKIDGVFITTSIEGQVDHLAEHQLLAVARLDSKTSGWVEPPIEKKTFTSDDIETKPGIKRKR